MNIKLTQPERQDICEKIIRWIDAGIDQKGPAPSGWWEEVERMYRGESPPQQNPKSYEIFHVPFIQPRIDALSANVCAALNRQDPIMIVDNIPEPLKAPAQRILHKMLTLGGIEPAMRKAATHAALLNKGIIRVVPNLQSNMPFSGGQSSFSMGPITLGSIHPVDFVMYPATSAGIAEAILVGHRFVQTVETIQHLRDVKTYYEGPAPGGGYDVVADDPTGRYRQTETSPSTGADVETSDVKCFNGLVFLDIGDGGKAYQFTVDHDNRELLSLEEYALSYAWYIPSACIEDDTLFWGGISVGNNLRTLQTLVNNVSSGLYAGSMATAFAPIFGPEPEQDMTVYPQGGYVTLPTGDTRQPWQGGGTFQGQPLVASLQYWGFLGDQVARVSQNTMGAPNPAVNTATENNIIANGVAIGIEEYINSFSSHWGIMARLIFEILEKWYMEEFPDPMDQEAIIAAKLGTWTPSGQSPGSTPSTKLSFINQALLPMSLNPAFGLNPRAVAELALANSPFETAAKNLFIPDVPVEMMNDPLAEADPVGEPNQPGIGEILAGLSANPDNVFPPQEMGAGLQ